MSSESSGECSQPRDTGTKDEQSQSLQQEQQQFTPEGDGESTGDRVEVKEKAGGIGGGKDAEGSGTGIEGGVEEASEEQSSEKQVQQPHQQTEGGDPAGIVDQVGDYMVVGSISC